ncbi:unnamed protein product [Owenia fusiformis]|uniref:Uncharacterized protein n=1 Tax=Owenia fusiformis TaxID=6347 RepID=A0A8S4PGB4_OWEFU|nr:unnamed protein product [Owenia fusiformis]
MLSANDKDILSKGPVINIQNWDGDIVDITDAASDGSFDVNENNETSHRGSQVIAHTPWSVRTNEEIIDGVRRANDVALPPLINPGVRVYGNVHKGRDDKNIATNICQSPKRTNAITPKSIMPLLEEQTELTSLVLPNMQQEGSVFTSTPPRSPMSPTVSSPRTLPRRDSENSLSSRSLLSLDSPRSISPRPPSSPRRAAPRVLARRASTPRLELRPISPPNVKDSLRSTSQRSPNDPTQRLELRPPSPPGELESYMSTSSRPSGLLVSRSGRLGRSALPTRDTNIQESQITNGCIHTADRQQNKRGNEERDKPCSNTVHHVNGIDMKTLEYDIFDKDGAVVSIADVSPDVLEKCGKILNYTLQRKIIREHLTQDEDHFRIRIISPDCHCNNSNICEHWF